MTDQHVIQVDTSPSIDWSRYRAVAADLDGVITRTAAIHSRAWKQVFDELLELRRKRSESTYEPFDEESDYPEVDGKSRLDGVRTFLKSRGIELAEGSDDDSLENQTVVGIGNRKNQIYNELLRRRNVPVYRPCVRLLRNLREQGYRLAIVSSSRNCQRVLEAADLTDLFDERIDGNTLREMNLKGKPAPDLFLEAARRLGVQPAHAVAIEDAPAGVESAARAEFGFVIAVARDGLPETLRERGAHVVVRSFDEIQSDESQRELRPLERLPDAVESIEDIRREVRKRCPAIFADYDGTLTPIVDRPEDAILSDRVRAVLQRISEKCVLAIVSGRGLDDVRGRVDLLNVWYAGSHGFELVDATGNDVSPGIGEEFRAVLDDADARLQERLADLEGIQVERKKFAIAVHYRRADPTVAETAQNVAQEVGEQFERLRVTGGKKIVELRPDVNWDKGRAVELIMDRAGIGRRQSLAIYLGDDDTDADAFRSVNDLAGLSIAVGHRLKESIADYRLKDVDGVCRLLELIADTVEEAEVCR